MTRLAEILDQMSAVLNDLKTVMDQEQQHLSMGQINGSQLQWITEQKAHCWRRWITSNSYARKNPIQQIALILVNAGRKNYCENAATTPNEST